MSPLHPLQASRFKVGHFENESKSVVHKILFNEMAVLKLLPVKLSYPFLSYPFLHRQFGPAR